MPKAMDLLEAMGARTGMSCRNSKMELLARENIWVISIPCHRGRPVSLPPKVTSGAPSAAGDVAMIVELPDIRRDRCHSIHDRGLSYCSFVSPFAFPRRLPSPPQPQLTSSWVPELPHRRSPLALPLVFSVAENSNVFSRM